MRNVVCLIWLSVGVAGSLGATSITVVNFSFEAPAVATFQLGAPTGWTLLSGSTLGVFRPTAAQFNSGAAGLATNPPNNLPDGLQTYFSNSSNPAAYIAQVLSTAIGGAGTAYTLGVYVGNRWDSVLDSYTVELFSGGVLLASTTDPVIPSLGQFAKAVLNYTANGTESGNLEIRLKDNGGGTQVNFDDVTLDAANTPEPASFALMGAGLAAALALRQRSRLRTA